MIRFLKAAAALLCAVGLSAFAQTNSAVRFDSYNVTSAKNVPFGAQAPLYTLPFSNVTVCDFPADGDPCTNQVPIYSDQAMTQPIAQPIQADGQGRFGFWVPPNLYTYSVTTEDGTSAGTFSLSLTSPAGPQGPQGTIGPQGAPGIGCATGNCVITLPAAGQTITQPTNTNLNISSVAAKSPRVDVRYPDFGVGSPIKNLTLSGNLSCAPNTLITVNISAPNFGTGVQAVANLGCSSAGQLYINEMNNEGAGYDSSATITVSGSGVSGVIATPILVTPGVADPSGVNCSDSAIQSAVDYSISKGLTSLLYPDVYIPGAGAGNYKLCSTIDFPTGITITGDSRSSSNVFIAGNFPAFVWYLPAIEGYGGVTLGSGIGLGRFEHINISANGNAHTSTMFVARAARGVVISDVNLSNSAGIGLSIHEGERNYIRDTNTSEVRFPIISVGNNETTWENVNLQDPGNSFISQANQVQYCWSINCINGVGVFNNWQGGTFMSASTDGVGGVATTVGKSTAPLIVGQWEQIAGIADLTAINGHWQITKALNGCSAASAPYNASSTCITPNASSFVTIASLTSGTEVQGPDFGPVILQNPTTATPAAGSATIGSATWKPALWPHYNPAVIDTSGSMNTWKRNSIKSNTNAAGFQANGLSPTVIEEQYIECAVGGCTGPGVEIAGAFPYTFTTSALTATNCTQNAFCPLGVQSFKWFFGQTFYPYQNDIAVSSEQLTIACSDYHPNSTTPCASNGAILQGQVEVLTVGFSQQTGIGYVNARNMSGSTAPANSVWPAGSIIGMLEGHGSSGQANLEAHDTHTNAYLGTITATSVYASLASDSGNFPSCEFCVGFIPDGVLNFTVDTPGQSTSAPGSLSLRDAEAADSNCSPANEPSGINCIKVIGRGSVAIYGQIASKQVQAPALETQANINNCSSYTGSSLSVIFAQYAGGINSVGSLVDESTGTIMYHQSLDTTPCIFAAKYYIGQHAVVEQAANEYLLQDLMSPTNTTPVKYAFKMGTNAAPGFTISTNTGSGTSQAFSFAVKPSDATGNIGGYGWNFISGTNVGWNAGALLSFNGQQGTAGQCLTSAGAGHTPIWGSCGSTGSITSLTSDPTGSCSTGSLASNSAGASGHVLWVCVASAWVDIK